MANDNANGILQLSTSHVNVQEGSTTPIVYVERSAGFFGEVCCLKRLLMADVKINLFQEYY